eukprot:m.694160 g.694160  ORF g.694160 m.694160 type:complete len:244 (-) comp58659_c1_seq3:39-770(-)
MSIAWRQERSADRPAAAESIHFLIYDIPKTLDWRQLHDTLTHIKFDGSRMDRDSFVAACTALRDCTAITHLGFTNSGITDTGPIGELLCFLPRLTDLFLGNNLICGLSEQFVGGLAHCPNIMQLSLSRNYIRDFDGLGYVIGEHCPRLQSLNIRSPCLSAHSRHILLIPHIFPCLVVCVHLFFGFALLVIVFPCKMSFSSSFFSHCLLRCYFSFFSRGFLVQPTSVFMCLYFLSDCVVLIVLF